MVVAVHCFACAWLLWVGDLFGVVHEGEARVVGKVAKSLGYLILAIFCFWMARQLRTSTFHIPPTMLCGFCWFILALLALDSDDKEAC